MENKAQKTDTAGREDFAPEVVVQASDLIPAQRDDEFPQPLPPVSYPYQSYQPTHQDGAAPSYEAGNTHSQYEKKDPSLGDGTVPAEVTTHTPNSKRRKRIIWIIGGVILLVLAIGLGVGLGVGLSQGDGGDAEESATPTTTAPPTSTTTTAAGITAGTTGLAAFSCTGLTEIESTTGTEYTQDCNRQYLSGRPSEYVASRNVQNLGNPQTLYSLQSCIDACDAYNGENNQPACRAVTYYANLTDAIPRYRGSCFLKSDRGTGDESDEGVDLRHTASAWQSCLNVTCFGSD